MTKRKIRVTSAVQVALIHDGDGRFTELDSKIRIPIIFISGKGFNNERINAVLYFSIMLIINDISFIQQLYFNKKNGARSTGAGGALA